MIVAIDAGNTRIKWGLHDGSGWVERGAFLTVDAEVLATIASCWPAEVGIVACNVAGMEVERTIGKALGSRSVHWLRSGAEACGLRNAYDEPERLGADRWAAMIGARGMTSGDCLVVCAGTATTIDWLDAQGTFRGGVILPGFELMRSSLAISTAQLPLAQGSFSLEPRNTMDAIVSGCLHAQIGAIERLFSGMSAGSGAICLLTGGAAPFLMPHLNIPFRQEKTLVLDGLVRFIASR